MGDSTSFLIRKIIKSMFHISYITIKKLLSTFKTYY